MIDGSDALIILLPLTNLVMLGSSRLATCIRTVAAQGILLGLLPLIVETGSVDARILVMAAVALVLKGIVFPWLLLRVLRQVKIRREVEPFVGFSRSIGIGLAGLVACMYMSTRLAFPIAETVRFIIPFSLFTIFTGIFIIITRKKAISMVLGYLVLENGIYAFGTVVAQKVPVLVEIGVLLDVWVAVFAMGIATFHISREFDHMDVDKLDKLKG